MAPKKAAGAPQALNPAKRKKLMSLRGLNSGMLSRVMAIINSGDDDAEDNNNGGVSALSLRREARSSVEHLCCDIELPLRGSDDQMKWRVALPQQMIPHMLAECPAWADQFKRSWSMFPPSRSKPWRLLVYHDEVGPGNQKKTDNRRMTMAVYISFLEFGSFLQDENSWIPLGCLRSALVRKSVAGGCSSVVRILLRHLFLGEHSLMRGVRLSCGTFHARFHRMIMDESAGKDTLCLKGSAGLRPCMNCKNVVLKQADSLADHDASGYLVPLTCADDSAFDPQSDTEILEAYDNLVHCKPFLSAARFGELERASGMNLNPLGLLSDLELRPIAPPSSYCRDPMHVLFASGGTTQVEIYALLRAVKQHRKGFTWKDLRSSIAPWRAGRGGAKVPLHILSDARESATKDAEHFVGQAGDCMALLPLLRRWAHEDLIPAGVAPAAVESFLAHCVVADMFMTGKREGASPRLRDELPAAVRASLSLHKKAHGDDLLKPKHHYMWHMATQPAEDGIWLDCFVVERKHIMLKSRCENIDNISNFEDSALVSMLTCYLEEAAVRRLELSKSFDAPPEVAAALGVASARVCRRTRLDGVTYNSRDCSSKNHLARVHHIRAVRPRECDACWCRLECSLHRTSC